MSGAGCGFRAAWRAAGGGGRGLLQFFGGFFAGAGRVNGHWGIILWGLDTRNIS